MSTEFNPQLNNLLIQNKSVVTIKDQPKQQLYASSNLDTSDIFNISGLGFAGLKERRLTHIEIARERLTKVPYYDCVLALRGITTENAPHKKLQTLLICSQMIERSIATFWEGMAIQKDKLSITVDEYLSIFMFIIVRSKIGDLEAHLYLVESFVDEFSLYQSREGQIFLTVQQATHFLRELDEERL